MGQIRPVNIDEGIAETPGQSARVLTPFVPRSLVELLQATPEEISRCDIALMNLLCATGLPGAENLDIARCLRRIDFMAEHIRKETDRDLGRARFIYKSVRPRSECEFRMVHLATAMQGIFKLRYDPKFLADGGKEANADWRTQMSDSRSILIHGLLGDSRSGVFAPIAVIAVAIGRRLGYPLYLSCTPHYVWVRWDGRGERFNADIINGKCSIDPNDGYYRTWPKAISAEQDRSGYFLKNLAPADDLALGLFCRAWVQESNLCFEESLAAWAKCCFFAPTNPEYARRAVVAVGEALYLRKNGRPMQWAGTKNLRPVEVVEDDPRKVLPPKLAALALCIMGHADEAAGRTGNALLHYGEANRTDSDHPDIRAGLDRLRKRIQDQAADSHRRTMELLRERGITPRVAQPPQTCDAAVAQSKPGSPEHFAALLHGLAPGYGAMGLELAREGKWAEAQVKFVQARGHAATGEEKLNWLNHLYRVVREEIHAPRKPQSIDEDEPAEGDPRVLLPPQLHAVIWAARGKVLESIGRLPAAADAYAEAYQLSPRAADYNSEAARIRREMVNQPAATRDVYPVGLASPPRVFRYHEIGLAPQSRLPQTGR